MSYQCYDARRSGLPRGVGRAHDRASCADEVIDDKRGCASYVAYEQVTRHHAGAAPLVGEALSDWLSQRGFESLVEQIRALGSAGIRRYDAEFFA